MSDLFLKLRFDMATGDCVFESNVHEESYGSLIEAVVRSHVGAGADYREAIERDIYEITIRWDLGGDTHKLTSNTGNDGLTTGILMVALKQCSSGEEEEIEVEK